MENKEKEKFSPVAAITYYFALPFIYLISILPFPVLYLFSDFIYLILFRIIGYRKEVVINNLKNSFPNKADSDINKICSAFYHNLCDFFLEIVKTMTISRKNLVARCKLTPEADALFSKLASEQKSFVMAMGHLGNWEWACNAFNVLSEHQLYVIYHPVSNKYFDGLMYGLRSRNGTKLIAMRDTYREMLANKNGLNATAFVADQTPQPDSAYWLTFLNQDTPVFKGMELLSKKMNLPVVYTAVKKVKRGYYEMHAEMLSNDPRATAEGELSAMYMKRLEQDIIVQPADWLWSHRRWKHKRLTLSQQ